MRTDPRKEDNMTTIFLNLTTNIFIMPCSIEMMSLQILMSNYMPIWHDYTNLVYILRNTNIISNLISYLSLRLNFMQGIDIQKYLFP